MIPTGTQQGKALNGEFAVSPEKGTEYVVVTFQIVGGPNDGQQTTWKGFFTPKSTERTIESLRYTGCTFPNNDVTDLSGLGSVVVPIVIEHDEYEGKTYARVAWVNNPAGAIRPEQQMDVAKKAAFKQRMLGAVAGAKTSNGTTPVGSSGTAKAPF